MSADPSPGADIVRLDLAKEAGSLRAVHDRLRRAEEFSRIGHWEFSLDDQIVHASEGAMRIYGLARADTPLGDIKGQALPEYRPILDRALRDLVERGVPYEQEFGIRRASDGEVVHVQTRAEHDVCTGRVFGVLQDITERRRAEEAARSSYLLLREVARQFPNGLLAVLDADLRHLLVDGEGLAKAGEIPSDRLGRTIAEVFEPETLAVIEPMHRAALAGRGSERDVAWRGRVVHVKTRPIAPDEDGRPRCLVMTQDVTERTRAAGALEASEAKYRGLFNSLMDGLVVVGMDGVIRESNEVYRRMLGYSAEEIAQLTHKDLTPERWHPVEARILAEQILPRGYSEVYEKEYRRKDGTVFPAEIRTFLLREDGRPAAMWAIVRDVTDVRALRMKLAVAGRMAALGTLVSGVAHEINNPLAAEMADQGIALEVVRELRRRLRGDAPIDRESEGRALDCVVEALEDAKESGERIARIVKDLNLFGRPDAKRQRARLMDIVDGALRWLPATVARTADIHVESGGAPDVIVSAGQIEQILVNLITNAAKATPEGQRDTVIVRIGLGPPGMVRVEVIDHGTGIDPAIRDHLFDPFFTTRPTGPERGTGLGLAICQAIATAHGGTLTFESEVGKGSKFRVELPTVHVEA
jgi:PAS domain S-box-containing protein